jgi:hypothetical protein
VTEQIHRLTLTPELRAESPYLAVPFEVPPGTESIEVELCFAHRSTRIDIGCEGGAGWHGWSGSARRRFAIGRDAATWGYVPGELEPGEWHVVLGLHVLPPGGLPIELIVAVAAHAACFARRGDALQLARRSAVERDLGLAQRVGTTSSARWH